MNIPPLAEVVRIDLYGDESYISAWCFEWRHLTPLMQQYPAIPTPDGLRMRTPYSVYEISWKNLNPQSGE